LRSVLDDRQGKAPRKLTGAAPSGVLNDALPDSVTGYRSQFPDVCGNRYESGVILPV